MSAIPLRHKARRYGRLPGKVLYRSGDDHLQIGGYRLGVYMGQGRLIAIVLVVLVMLAGSSIASVVLVVLSRTSIASVVLVMLARASIASVVLSRTAMVVLVEARAMVAVASVVARAMVVSRSTGGVSPIYMVDVGAVLPADGAVEVVCVAVFAPLSGREVAAYLAVAALPSVGVDVAIAAYAVEIVEIDVHETVALNVAQSQFHNHLVGDEACLRLNICKSLCIS